MKNRFSQSLANATEADMQPAKPVRYTIHEIISCNRILSFFSMSTAQKSIIYTIYMLPSAGMKINATNMDICKYFEQYFKYISAYNVLLFI